MKAMTIEDVRDLLREETRHGQKAWADRHGISPQYVCDVLASRKGPGDAILTALGVELVYRRVK